MPEFLNIGNHAKTFPKIQNNSESFSNIQTNLKSFETFHCCLNHLGLSEHSKTYNILKKKQNIPKKCKTFQTHPENSKTFQKIQNVPKHAKRNPANSETIQKKTKKHLEKKSQSEKMECSHWPDMVQYLHFRILKFPLMG